MDNETKSEMYYYSENGAVLGPFELNELAGKLQPDTPVFIENGIKWFKAEELPELHDILYPPEPELPPVDNTSWTSDIPSETSNESAGHSNQSENHQDHDQAVFVGHADKSSTNSNSGGYPYTPTAKKSNTGKIIFLVLLGVLFIGLTATIVNLDKIKDYLKWRKAETRFCYVSSLRIRTDTTTSNDYNVLPTSLRYGDSLSLIVDPMIAPWCEVRIKNQYTGEITQGFVNSYFLMNRKDISILNSLLYDKSLTTDSDGLTDKYKQVSLARYRKSIVEYVKSKYDYSNFENEMNVNAVDTTASSNSISTSSRPVLWALINNQYYGYRDQYIKTGTNRYITSEYGDGYITRDYAMFLLVTNTSEEIVVFIYENNIEIARQSFSTEVGKQEFNVFLNSYGLYY